MLLRPAVGLLSVSTLIGAAIVARPLLEGRDRCVFLT